VSQVATKAFDFTVVLARVDELTDEIADALFEAGCDDASLYSEGPTVSLEFHREADSLGTAVGSAIADVERAGFSVARVEMAPSGDKNPAD
jgi:hypothetical protein